MLLHRGHIKAHSMPDDQFDDQFDRSRFAGLEHQRAIFKAFVFAVLLHLHLEDSGWWFCEVKYT